MKNAEITAITNIYTARKGKGGDKLRLPAAVAWKRRVNMDKLFKARVLIDEAMQEISDKYADDEHSKEVTDESGEKSRVVRDEYLAEYGKAQMEILSQDTDIDVKKIKIEELGDLILSDEDLDTLAFMIEEE